MDKHSITVNGENYIIHKATFDDLNSIVSILVHAAKWIKEKGLNQWGYYVTDLENNKQEIIDSIKNRATFILKDEKINKVVATLTLEASPNEWDLEIWGKEAKEERVVYLHRLAIDRNYAGKRIGEALIRWAIEYAKEAEMNFLRLDCVGDNEYLNLFYQRLIPLKEKIDLYGGQSKYEVELI